MRKGLTHKEIQTAPLQELCQLYHHALWIWRNICLSLSHSAEESEFLAEAMKYAKQPTAECRLSCASKGHLRKTKISQRLELHQVQDESITSGLLWAWWQLNPLCMAWPWPSASRKNLWLQLRLSSRNQALGQSRDPCNGHEYTHGNAPPWGLMLSQLRLVLTARQHRREKGGEGRQLLCTLCYH